MATITSSAMTMIRFGALMAIRAICCSTYGPSETSAEAIVGNLSTVTYQRQCVPLLITTSYAAESFSRETSRLVQPASPVRTYMTLHRILTGPYGSATWPPTENTPRCPRPPPTSAC